MKRLTTKEEAIMQIIWQKGKAFAKEVWEEHEIPKPHINTVSTVMRKLVDKGYLAYEDFGSTYRYYPLISKEEYTRQILGPKLANFFDDSYKNVVAFFAKEEQISEKDLREIIEMIEKKKGKK